MNTNVSFSSEVRIGNPNVDNVRATYLPSKKKGSAMIVLHGFRMNKDSFLNYGDRLNRLGVSSFHPDLPYHGQRGLFGKGYHERGYSADEIRQALKQAYADIRKSVDWLEGQGHTNIGIGGYSLGGILTLLAMGKEPRLKSGIAVCAGGDLADIIFKSPISVEIASKLRRKGLTKEDFEENISEFEPCNYAENIKPGSLLMVNGLRDNIVPPSNSVKFIHSLKSPQKVQWQDVDHFNWKLDRLALKHVLDFRGGENASN